MTNPKTERPSAPYVLRIPCLDEESAQQWFAKNNGFDLDEFVTDADETFCRQLHRCPTHEAKDGDCTWCMFITEGEPWLDWTTQDGEGLLSNSGKQGYFPVVVWEVGA